MKMDFSKDELAMVYQYAAGTREDTLAGLKEIVPVIRDRQTREIVESTIRKLDAIPEPECRHFIADTKQRFIQKRDNSIRRRLAEAKAQAAADAAAACRQLPLCGLADRKHLALQAVPGQQVYPKPITITFSRLFSNRLIAWNSLLHYNYDRRC